MSRNNAWWKLPVAILVIVIMTVAGVLWLVEAQNPSELLATAKMHLKSRKYKDAEQVALRIRANSDLFGQARLVAGEAATRAGRPERAIEIYRSVPRDDSRQAVIAAISLGELLRDTGHLSEAATAYEYVLLRDPENWAVHRRLAFLLNITGQRRESLSHYYLLLKNDQCTFEELAIIGDIARAAKQPDFLRKCAKAYPNDVFVMLGLAAESFNEGRFHDALVILQKVLDQKPALLSAHAMLGEILIESESENFLHWNERLPATAEEWPEIWLVRGLWARRMGDLPAAARCFWETLRRDPTHRSGTYQLGQVLVSLNHPEAEKFHERYDRLYELATSLTGVLKWEEPNENVVRRVVSLLESTGRIWETCAWSSLAVRTFPPAVWARDTIARHSRQLQASLPQTLASADLSRVCDFSNVPIYQKPLLQNPSEGHHRSHELSPISFLEERNIGFDFVYHNGADPDTKGVRTFEQMGGGVSVLDYDIDGLPDLFLPQGKPWQTGSREPVVDSPLSDALFRNMQGSRFVDVSSSVGIVDRGFGQGCSAGDINNDGFPDLYVANVGRNQLYRNNGDGTFTDISEQIDERQNEWAASCVIVDLNADGMPDLFSVTYLTGKDIYEAVCEGRACSPKVFEGVPDRLHINKGDGSFEFVPDATPKDNSKGLGVIAFDWQTQGRPALFIANDQVPNFLLQNAPSSNRFNVEFENVGFSSGLAFNDSGLSVASMGIAADDVNGDGRIDFYVTTFKDEPKVLFLQQPGGLFVDATRSSGLREAGFPYVGWGAQFFDADLDGAVDLVVANGHVEDYRDVGGEYHMRPQFFNNSGEGRFHEMPPSKLGAFFGKKFLGRGLSRLDWNSDGLMDFVVSNIGDPASLVTNQTRTKNHFLTIHLHATKTARDAFGTVVQVETGERSLSKQLVAGDGYMATNERMLQFGLGDRQSVATVIVKWPSGSVSTVRAVAGDVNLRLIEGRSQGYCTKAGMKGSTIVVETTE